MGKIRKTKRPNIGRLTKQAMKAKKLRKLIYEQKLRAQLLYGYDQHGQELNPGFRQATKKKSLVVNYYVPLIIHTPMRLSDNETNSQIVKNTHIPEPDESIEVTIKEEVIFDDFEEEEPCITGAISIVNPDCVKEENLLL